MGSSLNRALCFLIWERTLSLEVRNTQILLGESQSHDHHLLQGASVGVSQASVITAGRGRGRCTWLLETQFPICATAYHYGWRRTQQKANSSILEVGKWGTLALWLLSCSNTSWHGMGKTIWGSLKKLKLN